MPKIFEAGPEPAEACDGGEGGEPVAVVEDESADEEDHDDLRGGPGGFVHLGFGDGVDDDEEGNYEREGFAELGRWGALGEDEAEAKKEDNVEDGDIIVGLGFVGAPSEPGDVGEESDAEEGGKRAKHLADARLGGGLGRRDFENQRVWHGV